VEFTAISAGDGLLLTAGSQRLRFDPDTDGQLRFTSQVLVGGEWADAAAMANTFVQGASFDLAPTRHQVLDAGPDRLEVRFSGEAPLPFEASVTAATSSPWIDVSVTVVPPHDLALNTAPLVEPWCVLWIGEFDRLRFTQRDAWRQVEIRAPTRSVQGQPGNDLPAAYLYDPVRAVEFGFFADLEAMTWMSDESLARFRDIEVGSVRTSGPQPRYGIGMHAHQRSGNNFPAGAQRFAYRFFQRHRATVPTQWEALEMLVRGCAASLRPSTVAPPSWSSVAAGTIVDLRDDARTMATVEGTSGHIAYARGTAPDARSIELMTLVDVLAPLAVYGRVEPAARLHADRLAAGIPHFLRPSGVFGNVLPAPEPPEVVDSWYFFENALIKLAWISQGRSDLSLQERFMEGLDRARDLAHRSRYLFPLFYLLETNEPTGTGTNLGVNGLYAYACLLGHQVTGASLLLDEAEQALTTLIRAPLQLLYHEPQELAFAALAAAMLPELGLNPRWTARARDLLHAQLRMAYWVEDPLATRSGYQVRGGFQACAGLLYPAFKENVESILPWTGVLRRLDLDPLLLTFMDLQRRHNRSFFAPGAHIPFEDLGTLELGPGVGRLGQEIYGAGEVFWSALCFDAVAHAEDPEICVVWLDALEAWREWPRPLHLAVFNPTATSRSTSIRITVGGGSTQVTLGPGECLRLDL
jgi:hypothetical protein